MQSINPQSQLVSIPNSLRQQIDRAQNLLDQSSRANDRGDASLAVVKAKESLAVLQAVARAMPELGMLGYAAELGYRGVRYKTTERVDRYQVVDRNFLGLRFGSEVVCVPTITTKIFQAELS